MTDAGRFDGELSLVLDPDDGRTGVYLSGDLLGVLDAGTWGEDVEADLSGGTPPGVPAGITGAGRLLLAELVAGGTEPPSGVARYRVRDDWRAVLDMGLEADASFSARFENMWPDSILDFPDLLVRA